MKILIILAILFSQAGCFLADLPSKSSDSVSRSYDSISRSYDSISKSSDSLQSISKSVKSISTSVTSILSSSSGKNEEKKKESFKNDIRETTAMHLVAGLNSEEFEYDLARIAMNHGISNWKRESYTYLGIGEGMKKAGVKKSEISKMNLPLAVQNTLLQGFDSI